MQKDKKKDLKRGIYIIPNLFTTGNMFCGFYAIIAIINEDFYKAAVAILLAAIFDSLDGRIARLTNSLSDFGVEYDSLADLISFGVAPGLLVYSWALKPFGRVGWLAALLFVMCGALRLARFNVHSGDNEKTDRTFFHGLPIPAAGGVIASSVILAKDFIDFGETKPVVVVVISYLLAFLMVSSIKYRSFKHLALKRKRPFNILVLTVLSLYIIVSIPQIMVFLLFLIYAFSGPLEALFSLRKQKAKLPRPLKP